MASGVFSFHAYVSHAYQRFWGSSPQTLGRAERPAPASVGFAALAWGYKQVCAATIHAPAFSAERHTLSRSLFFRCDSVRSTAGGCFPQRSLSATNRVRSHKAGDFAEPFPPPLRELLCPRRSSAPSRPARVCAPLDPRQGTPCTCPDPLFIADRGLSFSRIVAVENKAGDCP